MTSAGILYMLGKIFSTTELFIPQKQVQATYFLWSYSSIDAEDVVNYIYMDLYKYLSARIQQNI